MITKGSRFCGVGFNVVPPQVSGDRRARAIAKLVSIVLSVATLLARFSLLVKTGCLDPQVVEVQAGKCSTPLSSRSGSAVSMTSKWAMINLESNISVRSLAARPCATKDRSADPLQRCDDVMPYTLIPSSLYPSSLRLCVRVNLPNFTMPVQPCLWSGRKSVTDISITTVEDWMVRGQHTCVLHGPSK